MTETPPPLRPGEQPKALKIDNITDQATFFSTIVTQLNTWLLSENPSAVTELDPIIHNTPIDVLYAAYGIAKLEESVSMMADPSRMQALDQRITQLRKQDSVQLQTTWRNPKYTQLDQALMLIGNTNLVCSPKIAWELINFLTKERDHDETISSPLLGETTLKYPYSPIQIQTKEKLYTIGEQGTWSFSPESRITLLLSYARKKSLLNIATEAKTNETNLENALLDLLLYGLGNSGPFRNKNKELENLPAKLCDPVFVESHPKYQVLIPYLKKLLFTGSIAGQDLRLRIEFYNGVKTIHPQIQNDMDRARKLSKALAQLLLTGYPVGIKTSSPDLSGSQSSLVLYVHPIALLKTLETLASENVILPDEIREIEDQRYGKESSIMAVQTKPPYRFSLRGSKEYDPSPTETKTTNKIIQEGIRKIKILYRKTLQSFT